MEFVDIRLARRFELAHAHRTAEYAWAQEALAPQLDASVEPIGAAMAVYAGPNSPVNGVRGLGMSGAVRPDELEQATRFFESRKTPARVAVCPLADRSLTELLARQGFRLEGFFSVLAMPTITRPRRPADRDIEIREVETGEEDRWLETVAAGFADAEGEALQAVVELIRPTLHSASARSFLALVGGQRAGGGTVIVHRGVAELCSASTVPTFRGRGVQTALIHARLAAARHAGCDVAMVVTSPGTSSQRNVERTGFQLAYTRAVVSRD
jgi:GNAT superfamily N-acetyltransferase